MNQILQRLKQERRRALILLIVSLSIIAIGQLRIAIFRIDDTDTAPQSAGPTE